MSTTVADTPTWFANQPAAAPVAQERTGSTYLEAIRWALEDELEADDTVVVLGQDIGLMGGAFRVTQGLMERFGEGRVIDTPIAEVAMVGAGIGLAISGWRPVVELQFADFVSCAYDQLVTEAAKLHYRFGIPVPMVVRAPSGGGVGAGPFHSQNPEGIFAHVPGLKVVCPGTPQDAYDLFRAAVHDPNHVLYFEHKALYRSLRGPVERGGPIQDLGTALVRRPGDDVTVITYGGMVGRCLAAADAAATEGVEAEVVDLRTVHPLDTATVLASVGRTGRAVVVHEDTGTGGIGAEVAARIADAAFYDLDAPIRRVTAPDTPVPFAQPLEERFVPSVERVRAAIEELGRVLSPECPAIEVPSGFDLVAAHRWMVLSRSMEDRLTSLYKQSGLRGRLVTGRGQEAIPVGSAMSLRDGDVIAPVHRDLGAHLVRGTEPIAMFRSYLGRVTGLSRGRDSDVHMGDWSKGVYPMVSHLPDSWPVIGGVAFGFHLDGSQRVAMAYCGDGAMSTGTWHESVNFAAVFDLPIVYVVENNQFAYSTPTSKQSRLERLSDRAGGYGIPGVTVDGNDVAAVWEATTEAVALAHAGGGPSLVECVTMRMDGHAIHDDASYVPAGVLEHWRQRDPIERAEAALRSRGWTDAEGEALRAEIAGELKAALVQAQSEPLPEAADLEVGVYASR